MAFGNSTGMACELLFAYPSSSAMSVDLVGTLNGLLNGAQDQRRQVVGAMRQTDLSQIDFTARLVPPPRRT